MPMCEAYAGQLRDGSIPPGQTDLSQGTGGLGSMTAKGEKTKLGVEFEAKSKT